MDREQAVKYLLFCGFSEEQIKAIEGAFTCEDAISRKAVLNMDRALDEAIKHSEEVAEEKFDSAVCILDKTKSDVALSKALECKKCAEEHRQLAEWLKELKQLREQTKMGCKGCKFEKTGNNSIYPCSHCSRCYTDKYKAESESTV